jgi:FMN phosphatase YigB (HAD superfamily)
VNDLTELKAVLFDLHGTLVFKKHETGFEEVSEYLFAKGYEVSPQQLEAASSFVSMIDYPKYGCDGWNSCLKRILYRLDVRVDDETLERIVQLCESNPYTLYPDALGAIIKVKENGLKTAIVTTIARFKFEDAIQPIRQFIDLIMTGYEAGVDKSNPKMYMKVLDALKIKSSAAVMIGDEVALDVQLPRRLGMKAILLDREGKDENSCIGVIATDLNEAIDVALTRDRW